VRILFLTRVYPPTVGGMEAFSYNLIANFRKLNKKTWIIANKKGKKYLPLFLPYSFFKSLFIIKKNEIEYLHLSDALMSPLGFLLKILTGTKTVVTIHGLDITYDNFLYQKIVIFSLKRLDKLFCVSNHTKKECLKRGLEESRCSVIPNGVNPKGYQLSEAKSKLLEKLSEEISIPLENKTLLLSVGRLIKRKGINWFINRVINSLPKNYIYLISGDGPERQKIQQSIVKKKLENRVYLLGKTGNNLLKLLYNCSDVFIMPNITVKGDMEGFGIVILEAGSAGLPVVASGIEGIKDAVLNGQTGILVPERNVWEYLEGIKKAKKLQRKLIKNIIKNNFSWESVAEKYYRSIIEL